MLSRNSIRTILYLFFILSASCATYEPFYSERVKDWQTEIPAESAELTYSVFLMGDSRSAFTHDSFLSLLEGELSEAGENSAVLFLGNQVYPDGLPDSTSKSWDLAQESLLPQALL